MANGEQQQAWEHLLGKYGENLPAAQMHTLNPVNATAALPPVSKLSQLLEGSKVSHLISVLDAHDVDLASLRTLGRQGILDKLKAIEIKLSDRQAVANLLSKAERDGRLHTARTAPHGAPSSSSFTVPAGVGAIYLPEQKQTVRVFAISDIHSDHPANMSWLKQQLPARRADTFDVLLCAGDVSDKEEVREEAFMVLKDRFDEIVFTIGNHDVRSTIYCSRLRLPAAASHSRHAATRRHALPTHVKMCSR